MSWQFRSGRLTVSCVHTPGKGAAHNNCSPAPRIKVFEGPNMAAREKVQVPFLFSWWPPVPRARTVAATGTMA